MEKILSFFIFCLTVTFGFSQTVLTVGAPVTSGTTSAFRAPNGTTAHTTLRGHMVITQAEMANIPAGTVIDGLGFLYDAGVNVPAGGNLQFYLENTADVTNQKSAVWATAISTMTSVYNGPYNIPTTPGATNVVTNGTFTYTGGGVYVAYDYLGTTFGTVAATYLCTTTIPAGTKMDGLTSTIPPTNLSQVSDWRPEIQFSFVNPFTNNVGVVGINGDHGEDNIFLGNSQDINATISNLSSVALTNIPVSLNITGANPYSTTQTVASIAPGASSVVSFLGVPKVNQGSQTIVVSVPPDQQTSNDTYTLEQNILCDTVGYGYGDSITGGVGYDTGTGIFANLLVIPAGPAMHITKVLPTIADGATNVGKTIKGVLLNSAGVIVDSTLNYVIATGDLGNQVSLDFINGAVDYAGDSVYFGFRQIANTIGFFPLATQNIAGVVPADKFCGFASTGGGYLNFLEFGEFLISAVLSPDLGFTTNAVNNGLCVGTALNVSASPGFTNYDFIVDGSSVQSGTGTSYSYTPTATTIAKIEAAFGVCPIADSITVNQASQVSSYISASICSGSTYYFNGDALTTPGTYIDTVPASAGCDSIITLTLSGLQASSYTYSDEFCDGTIYTFNSQNIVSSGTYTATLPNSVGCDSVITLNLTKVFPTTANISVTECATSYQFGSQTLTNTGTYSRVLTNAAGCDSTITLALTLNTPPVVSTTLSGSILTANVTPVNSTLQWVECPGYTPITGQTATTFQPSVATGNYAVIATGTTGCLDTSACSFIDQTGLEEMDFSSTLRAFPNPAVDVLHITSNTQAIIGYKIYDVIGKVVLDAKMDNGQHTLEVQIGDLAKGAYKIELITQTEAGMIPFIKN